MNDSAKKIQAWFLEQSERDQSIVLVVFALTLITFAWIALLSPAYEYYSQNRSDLVSQNERLLWFADQQHLIDALIVTEVGRDQEDSIIAQVSGLADKNSLQIKRIQPGPNGVKVWIADAPGKKIIDLVQSLEAEEIKMLEFSMNDSRRQGYFTATVLVK